MDFTDDEPQARFRRRLRTWLARQDFPEAGRRVQVATVAERFRELHDWHGTLFRGGWLGLDWPAELGGAGLDATYQLIFTEELSRAGAPPVANWVGLELVAPVLLRWGTEQQRHHHLPRILDGRSVWCQGFSEAEAGSDIAAVTTRAARSGDGFVIDGAKRWTSWAQQSTHCLVLARTGADGGRHRGLTCFVVPLDHPGVAVRPIPMLYGDAEECDVTFTGVDVPADAVVGSVDQGWAVIMTSLSHARGSATLSRITALQQSFADLVAEHGARSLRDGDTGTQSRLALLQARLQALRYLAYRKIGEMLHEGAPGHVASTEKLLWAQLNVEVARLGVQWQGLSGTLSSGGMSPEQGWLREYYRALAGRIEGGTDEIQRTIVARHVLGLPA